MKLIRTQPSFYDPGVWQICVRLDDSEADTYEKMPIPFLIPTLPARRIQGAPDYMIAVPESRNSVTWKGVFRGGTWRGHIYTEGVPEAENPTTIQAVEDALEGAIASALDIAREHLQ